MEDFYGAAALAIMGVIGWLWGRVASDLGGIRKALKSIPIERVRRAVDPREAVFRHLAGVVYAKRRSLGDEASFPEGVAYDLWKSRICWIIQTASRKEDLGVGQLFVNLCRHGMHYGAQINPKAFAKIVAVPEECYKGWRMKNDKDLVRFEIDLLSIAGLTDDELKLLGGDPERFRAWVVTNVIL